MAENIRTTPLRIRPSEYRSLLVLGDLLMAVVSVFTSLYVWRQYNFYVILAGLLADGVAPGRAEQRARILNNLEPQFWFYLLPIVWLFLLIELYDPHVAGSGRRTTRGIALAAFLGLVAYSLVFIVREDTNLPRVGVGTFLLFASLL
ncbi:MAG TPA: hypothetical protein VIR02_16840, partial [Anaerolineales bacterium]